MNFLRNCCLCFLLLTIPTGWAQDDADTAELARKQAKKEERKERWEAILESIREVNRERVLRHLEVIISEITRCSKLDMEQEAKLKVGAKGATEKALEDWVANLERQEGLIHQLEAMVANQPKAKKGADGKKPEVDFGQVVSQWGRQLQPRTAESHTLWATTIDKTLTKEQKAAWEVSKKQRAEFVRSLHLARMVQSADSKLRFTSDQRQRFLKILEDADQNKGDKAAGGAENPVAIQANGRVVIRQMIQANGGDVRVVSSSNSSQASTVTFKKLDRKKLAEFFSDAQMDLWEDMVKTPNQQRGNVWNGGLQIAR